MKTLFADVKEWKCKKGHVLGVVRRVQVSLSGRTYHVAKLFLYRHAIDMQADDPAEVDVIGPVEGSGGPFQCDVEGCGQERKWEIGEDALERLLEKIKGGE
jgi:hypothetical protein